jgi:nicotinate phosphoribosyltransferase
MRLFHTATDEEIKKGETMDVYFDRTLNVLKAEGLDGTNVVAEATVNSIPEDWS